MRVIQQCAAILEQRFRNRGDVSDNSRRTICWLKYLVNSIWLGVQHLRGPAAWPPHFDFQRLITLGTENPNSIVPGQVTSATNHFLLLTDWPTGHRYAGSYSCCISAVSSQPRLDTLA